MAWDLCSALHWVRSCNSVQLQLSGTPQSCSLSHCSLSGELCARMLKLWANLKHFPSLGLHTESAGVEVLPQTSRGLRSRHCPRELAVCREPRDFDCVAGDDCRLNLTGGTALCKLRVTERTKRIPFFRWRLPECSHKTAQRSTFLGTLLRHLCCCLEYQPSLPTYRTFGQRQNLHCI